MKLLTCGLLFILNQCFTSHAAFYRVCYFSNWAQYRPGGGKFSPRDIDPFLCTHIVYAFSKINNETLLLDKVEHNDEILYTQVSCLKVEQSNTWVNECWFSKITCWLRKSVVVEKILKTIFYVLTDLWISRFIHFLGNFVYKKIQ